MGKLLISLLLASAFVGCFHRNASTPHGDTQPDSLAQMRQAAQVIMDSLVQARTVRFNEAPLITQERAAAIGPAIGKWLDYYGLDIRAFRCLGIGAWRYEQSGSLDYGPGAAVLPFRTEQEQDDLAPVVYSPDKRRYVDLDLVCRPGEGGRWHFEGRKIEPRVFVCDRKSRKNYLLGPSPGAEAAFWVDNGVFAVVGRDFYDHLLPVRSLEVWDMRGGTVERYRVVVDAEGLFGRYLEDIFLPERGIAVDTSNEVS